MEQLTLARQADFQQYSKKTRREEFLDELDAVKPWTNLLTLVAPHYSKGEKGHKSVGVEITLRVCFLQPRFAGRIPAWKTRCTRCRCCAASPVWTLPAPRYRTGLEGVTLTM